MSNLVLLAKTWTPDIDPTGYYISAKKDGLRAVWNGRYLHSREGNRFPAPDWFTAQLPKNVALDGELWLGHNKLQETTSIVTSGRFDKGWNRLTYMLFDLPEVRAPFEQRLQLLHKIAGQIKICHILDQIKCEGREHLAKALEVALNLGEEGVMLRRPGSFYEKKRSSTLYKVKIWIDAEALVIAHTPGQGQFSKAMGNLVCQLPDGTQFEVGTGFTVEQRYNPPPVGCTIMFRYRRMTTGKSPKPYAPSFRSVRPKGT